MQKSQAIHDNGMHMDGVALAHQRLRGGAILYDTARIMRPDAVLFDTQGLPPVSSGGRNAAWYVEGPFGEAVLRHYRRGGLIARFVERSYWWTGEDDTRSFAELRLLAWMHGQGLPVPRPLAAAYWRRGPLYQAAILVQRIPDVRTLAQCLRDNVVDSAKVAQAICAMHDAGVWHADLNAHNLLVDAQTVWIIDFDRGQRIDGPLPKSRRVANLQRLRRSMNKLAPQSGEAVWQQMYAIYCKQSGILQ